MKLFAACLLLLASCAATPRPSTHAVVHFDKSNILSSKAGGFADNATQRRLTIDDPVRIASISKLVVALGVLRLVEAGTLDLDADVSDRLGWRLRNPAFPDRPISLRLLLSHRSSLRDDIDYAVPLGRDLRSALTTAAFDPVHPPGSYFTYSNLNFPVIAQVMEAATGERFDLLMRRLVLAPLDLDACFNWPTCSPRAISRAVVLRDASGKVLRDDLQGKQPACPVATIDPACDWRAYIPGTNGALFSPQGGLRISARGLAIIGRLLLDDGGSFLTKASIATLSANPWRYEGSNGETNNGFYCGYGLALQILAQCPPRDDPFTDARGRHGHAGEAYGVRSGLWIDRQRGTGIAYFATSIPEAAPTGRSSYTATEEWLARR